MNYSLHKSMPKKDKRKRLWKKQRKKRGFDNTELWNLYHTIAKFVHPRLKAFSKNPMGHPGYISYDEWKRILKKMVVAFKEILDEDKEDSNTNYDAIEEGLQLFSQYYRHLWD